MKFTSILSLLCAPAVSGLVNSGKDRNSQGVLGGAMWIFGDDGLSIRSPDGSVVKKSLPAPEICHNVSGYRGEAPSLSCSFYDIISDGKKYVWAAVSRGVSKVDVFDIDTGDIAGSFETCNTPRDLEYHSLRDEIWVRCSAFEDDQGYMNSFSASSPTGANPSSITFGDNTTLSSYGYTAVENSLGDVAYSTNWHDNNIYKIDLSAKTVIDSFPVPNGNGNYELAYSRVNRHIYVRALTCCTCGFENSDLGLDCGRYGSELVDVKTGPFAGSMNISGQCNRCDGSAADTIGVVEFDSNTDTIVANHLMKEGFGGDPFASPDGEYIVMFARNGGKTIRILKAQGPGEKSTVAHDLELNFNFGDNTDDQVFNDFAFIQNDGTNMIIFASGTENKLAYVDLSTSPPTISYTTFGGEELSASRNRRQIEWAVGTPYVWVDGSALDELYIFDIEKKEIVRTLNNVKSTKVVFVDNYERKRTAELMATMMANGEVKTTDGNSLSFFSEEPNNEESKVDPVGIAALIIALVACFVGIANLVVLKKKGETETKLSIDEASLGSKNVA